MACVITWSVCKVVKTFERSLNRESFRLLRPAFAPYLNWTQWYCNNSLNPELSHPDELAKSSEKRLSDVRYVPRTIAEFSNQVQQEPVQPTNPRQLFVAILGAPNAGKSTLTNSLVKWRVCSVSKKVHTTRHKAAAVLNEEDTQIVFLDTPGLITALHSKRHNLETSLVSDPERSLLKADLIAVVVDAGNRWTRHVLDPLTLNLLQQYSDKKSILILNKVDLIKSKQLLLEITRILTNGTVGGVKVAKICTDTKKASMEDLFKKTELKLKAKDRNYNQQDIKVCETTPKNSKNSKGWSHFSNVFMLSALEGDGVNEVRDYMIEIAKPAKWTYHGCVITNQNPYELGKMTVREKLLDFLPEEIPYQLDVDVEMWQVDEAGVLRICMVITCSKYRYSKILIGPHGKNISKVSDEARQELSNVFHCDVSLKLIVKSKQKPPEPLPFTKPQQRTNRSKHDDDDDSI